MKLIAALILLTCSLPVLAQQTASAGPYMLQLATDNKSIPIKATTPLDLLVMDSKTMAPVGGLKITGSLEMPEMGGMDLATPVVVAGSKAGLYVVSLVFPMKGNYKLVLNLQAPTGSAASASFTITPTGPMAPASPKEAQGQMKGMPGMGGMAGMQMKGTMGDWSMNREGSGTSWQPDSSPMFMKDLSSQGGFDVGMMGILQTGYVDDGGRRGNKGFFGDSMIMLMGRRPMGSGILGLHFMTSIDPVLNGKRGVPNLFENPFDVNGVAVADRKDPHNVFAEVAGSFSHPIGKDWTGFFYGGPVGEPALGNVMFLHRPSGLEIPEAPISHDWFDGTHISFGVVTLGIVVKEKWKLEGSAFNGRDPLNLYGIGPLALNSTSGRLSYNPSRDWSLSTSYGNINSDASDHRLTLGASYSRSLSHGDNLSVTSYFGQNIVAGSPNSNAWLAETTYYHAKDAFFVRFERVDKDELVNVPPGNYTIHKLLFGDVHNLESRDGFDYGLGAYAGVYSFPSALNASYGKSPLTLGIFIRIRPGQM